MTAPKSLPLAGVPTAAPPGGGSTPVRCTACGHVQFAALRCVCGHLDVFHAFNTANTVRKACSHHEGARNTRCPCTAFTPDFPQEND